MSHHVAVTSTLPVFELYVPGRPPPQRRSLDAMSTSARESYLTERASLDPADTSSAALFRKEMDFERAFAASGGLLLAGPDPTGSGGVLPGFGNQREVELLVEAGFTPRRGDPRRDAKRRALPGARGGHRHGGGGQAREPRARQGRSGASRSADIENVEVVFKDGIGYDSARLIESVRGQVGVR